MNILGFAETATSESNRIRRPRTPRVPRTRLPRHPRDMTDREIATGIFDCARCRPHKEAARRRLLAELLGRSGEAEGMLILTAVGHEAHAHKAEN